MTEYRNSKTLEAPEWTFRDASCNLQADDCNQLEKGKFCDSNAFFIWDHLLKHSLIFPANCIQLGLFSKPGKSNCDVKNENLHQEWRNLWRKTLRMHSSSDGMCGFSSRCFLSGGELKCARNIFRFNLHQSKYFKLTGRLSAQLKLIHWDATHFHWRKFEASRRSISYGNQILQAGEPATWLLRRSLICSRLKGKFNLAISKHAVCRQGTELSRKASGRLF